MSGVYRVIAVANLSNARPQSGGAARLPGRRHRDPTAGRSDGARHRLARRLVHLVPREFRPRRHTQRPQRRPAGPRTEQTHSNCLISRNLKHKFSFSFAMVHTISS